MNASFVINPELSLSGKKHDAGRHGISARVAGTAGPLRSGAIARKPAARHPDKGPALPLRHESSILALGEGMTPLLSAGRIGAKIGASALLSPRA